METLFLNDAARVLHLVGLALGLGAAIIADGSAARMLFRPLSRWEIHILHRLHRLVWIGLALFWISGLALIGLRTNFDLSQFTPKLVAKLLVVCLLTVNAVLIGRIGMPIIDILEGHRFGALGIAHRLQMAAVAGMSTASWISALCLGAFSQMKTMNAESLSEIIGLIYAGTLTGALCLAILAPIVQDGLLRRRHTIWHPPMPG